LIAGRAGAHVAMRFEDDRWGGRLCLLDLARTVALSQMIVFHFAKDMELFGLIAPGTTLTGGWAVFAGGIAASFLFFSGMSLVLAHARGFRGRAWLRRLLLIAGAACLVSVVTYAVFPSRFIYFGILHALAAASLLGLPFLFLPVWASFVVAISVLVADAIFGRAVFTSSWLAWTGLGRDVRASLDFIPLVPWLAPFLLGIAFARIVDLRRLEPAWPRWFPVRAATWPGRQSLAVYLLHQPVLLALVWAAARVAS
jgi:uncharacterized membrane protein